MSYALAGAHRASRYVAADYGLSLRLSDNLGDSSPNWIRQ